MTDLSAAFDLVRRHVAESRLPTAVLGVADAQGILALDAFGAREDARYLLYSVTKPLVGITAARLVQQGLLTPQTPLAEALPGFGAEREDTVRLRHLVSHTAGIAEPPLDSRAPLREELLQAGRDFAAGSASRYSSLAFEGVAALIEHAGAAPWDRQLRDWTASAGAAGLSLEPGDALRTVDAAAAGMDEERLLARRHPGAGLSGTAADLLSIGRTLLSGGGDVLRPATLAMTLRPLTGDIPRLDPYPAERGQDWGFSWNLPRRAPGLIDTDLYGHGGWAGTAFWVHPGAGICWVLLTNRAWRPGVDVDAIDNAVIGAL